MTDAEFVKSNSVRRSASPHGNRFSVDRIYAERPHVMRNASNWAPGVGSCYQLFATGYQLSNRRRHPTFFRHREGRVSRANMFGVSLTSTGSGSSYGTSYGGGYGGGTTTIQVAAPPDQSEDKFVSVVTMMTQMTSKIETLTAEMTTMNSKILDMYHFGLRSAVPDALPRFSRDVCGLIVGFLLEQQSTGKIQEPTKPARKKKKNRKKKT